MNPIPEKKCGTASADRPRLSEGARILFLLEQDLPESLREGAQLAGEAMLPEAIPALVRNMSNTNTGVQEAVDRALRKIGGPAVARAIIPMLRLENAPVRNLAMDILRELGRSDLPAIEQLLHDDDPDIRIFAADILGSAQNPSAVPPLCAALLQDPEVNVRYQAAVSLGTLAYPESAHCLNTSLGDEEWVQFAAVEALTKIRDVSSIEPMLAALDQATDLVAFSMVDALEEMGGLKAVPLLMRRLKSSPTPLCHKIVCAVINIMGPQTLHLLGKKACEQLRGYLPSTLKDEDPHIQDAAVTGFASLGGDGATAFVLRHAALLDPDKEPERIAAAVDALIKIGPSPDLDTAVRKGDERSMQIAMEMLLRQNAILTVPLLVETFWNRSRDMQRIMIMHMAAHAEPKHQNFFLDVLQRHEDGIVLRGALLFLGSNGDAETVFPAICPMLEHPYFDVKDAALEALIALHTKEVEELFRHMAKNGDDLHRLMGVYGLGHFDTSRTVDELTAALDDESPCVRKTAVRAFKKNCSLNENILAAIERKLHDENGEVRMAAFEALKPRSCQYYVDNLITGLRDPHLWVRIRCVERLGENKSTAAEEALLGILQDENPLVVIKAASALGNIGGEAAVKGILPLLEHPNPTIQETAKEAVNSILGQAGRQ